MRIAIVLSPADEVTVTTGGGGTEITAKCSSEGALCLRDEADRGALLLSAPEADVLQKMLAYSLEKVRMTNSSREVLESLQPRLRALSNGVEVRGQVAGGSPRQPS